MGIKCKKSVFSVTQIGKKLIIDNRVYTKNFTGPALCGIQTGGRYLQGE